MKEQELYETYLRKAVHTCIKNGFYTLHDVLIRCESADPRLVAKFLTEELSTETGKHKGKKKQLFARELGHTHHLLPAPNPSYSQWWFASSGINHIRTLLVNRSVKHDDPNLLCIGCPSIAHLLGSDMPTTLLDIDNDVIETLAKVKDLDLRLEQYNVYDKLPKKLTGQFALAIIDPPWYETITKIAINRALSGLRDGGDLYCTLPGKLTRPGVEGFRTALIEELVSCGHHIIAIEHDRILYEVPSFEMQAFSDLKDFRAIPWRKGDLLHVQKLGPKQIKVPHFEQERVPISFSRNPSEFRVFMRGSASLSGGLPPEGLAEYSNNVSTRASGKQPDVWTTNKSGLKIGNYDLIKAILEKWAKGLSIVVTIEKLVERKVAKADVIKRSVRSLEEQLKLWSVYGSNSVFKDPEKIIEESVHFLAAFATRKATRVIPESSDGFRPPFSRDRDRIIWSNSLRRLADKTQLFPSKADDSVRRRLTHTLEVMQLASTIASNLGLNNDLVEASALAHDLGHTPFGHAGEYAIDRLFHSINTRLGGFNHYEQGLDTVLFLESPYQYNRNKAFTGLNLSKEVLEAIVKHTFAYDNHPLSSVKLLENSKHSALLPPGYCHLEGQAVRIADKISYLISDIEDGLKIGAITLNDILDCAVFHRTPLTWNLEARQSGLDQYLEQRAGLIGILMQDVISASTRRIMHKRYKGVDEIRNANEFTISFSEEMQNDVNQVWKHLQQGRLFNHKRVLSANLFAARVVSELVIVLTLIPNLIDSNFRRNHEQLGKSPYLKHYRKRVGPKISIRKDLFAFVPVHLMIGKNIHNQTDITDVDVAALIMAKDYVCSLSDYKARLLHNEFLKDSADT